MLQKPKNTNKCKCNNKVSQSHRNHEYHPDVHVQASTRARKASNPPKDDNDSLVSNCKCLQACLGLGLGP